MEWQPIETAPKDGTAILIWDTYVHDLSMPVVGSWVENTDYGGEFEWEHWKSGGVLYNPTHWMPLPTPPKEQ